MLQRAKELIDGTDGPIVCVTGAGISAASGIPTFRGKEGYWTVGSREYHPQEMATHAAFSRMPAEVWRWYLYRRSVCRNAAPNPGHEALVAFEKRVGNAFSLLTQNVDGLHLRAGQSRDRTYEIHGNIDFMRCAQACTTELFAIPDLGRFSSDSPLEEEQFARLTCGACAGPSRPHVLWFDECYDEELYRFESSLRRADEAALVLTIGTTASTTLPNLVVERAAQNGVPIIDINPDENPFANVAARGPGMALTGGAETLLPALLG